MTRNEQIALYKKGYIDGFKTALEGIKQSADIAEEMLPIIPEELFKDGADPQTLQKVNDS